MIMKEQLKEFSLTSNPANFFVTPEFWWVSFPIFFWGIGILVDFLKAFVLVDNYTEEYRQRKIDEEMEKMKL